MARRDGRDDKVVGLEYRLQRIIYLGAHDVISVVVDITPAIRVIDPVHELGRNVVGMILQQVYAASFERLDRLEP